MRGYSVLIVRNISNTQIFVPDLELDFQTDAADNSTIELIKFIQGKILDKLNDLEANSLIIPDAKSISFHAKSENPIKENFTWMKIYVNFNPKVGIFEAMLPKLGVLMKLVCELLYAIVTLTALQIVTGKNGDYSFAIFGMLCGFTMAFTSYCYSNARKDHRQLGAKTTDLFHLATQIIQKH